MYISSNAWVHQGRKSLPPPPSILALRDFEFSASLLLLLSVQVLFDGCRRPFYALCLSKFNGFVLSISGPAAHFCLVPLYPLPPTLKPCFEKKSVKAAAALLLCWGGRNGRRRHGRERIRNCRRLFIPRTLSSSPPQERSRDEIKGFLSLLTENSPICKFLREEQECIQTENITKLPLRQNSKR